MVRSKAGVLKSKVIKSDNKWEYDVRYFKGKIYELSHKDFPNDIYIGSTIQTLDERFSQHPYEYSTEKTKFFEDAGWEGVKIRLVKNAPCYNKRELEFCEQQVINRRTPTLNTGTAYKSTSYPKPDYNILHQVFNDTFWKTF